MAIPIIKINLAPPNTLWRKHNVLISWLVLVFGGLILSGAFLIAFKASQEARSLKKQAADIAVQDTALTIARVNTISELQDINVAKELKLWQLAERIYAERSLPWSRLEDALEHSLVDDVRLKSVKRNAFSDKKIKIELNGEARSRDSEAAFMEALKSNPLFKQITIEKENNLTEEGIKFTYMLDVDLTHLS